MGAISTKELFDAYFSELEQDGVDVKRIRAQVDRKEVYNYEEKIGKQLVEMSGKELLDMIKTFDSEEYDSEYLITSGLYSQVSVRFRKIFDFYIKNYHPMYNPWNDTSMRGKNALNYLTMGTSAYTFDNVETIINQFRRDYTEARSDFLECMLRMHHEGVMNSDEITGLTNKDVNIRTRKIKLPGREILLTSKTADLLYTVHNMTTLGDGKSIMAQWNDSYFRFPVRKSEVSGFNERPRESVSATLSRSLSKFISKPYKFKVNSRMLFMLGFYDFLAARFGEEETDRIILGKRDSEGVDKLMVAAREYGINPMPEATKLKYMLLPYVKNRDGFEL